jgi:predicted ATP-grasp superfamily ATP-dependent carboligase
MRELAPWLFFLLIAAAGLIVPSTARARVQPQMAQGRSRRESPTLVLPNAARVLMSDTTAAGEEAPASFATPAGSARGTGRREKLPPVFLTMPNYHGTLAAVRNLGRQGIPVTTGDPSRFVVSAWSKYTTKSVLCPPVREADRFIEWLIAFGKTHETHVLLPTCDDTAWLYSRYRDELSKLFHLASPPISVVHGLLNKRLLHEHAAQAGIVAPRTWFPRALDDLSSIADEVRFPVVVKPITQVLFETRSKGVRVDTPDKLDRSYRRFAEQVHGGGLLEYDASVALPMVQEYYPQASTGIYNVSSYARAGKLLGARAARKILQRPRRLGVGVCFEEAPLSQKLLAGLERMVANVGYNGVFEAEFIDADGEMVLIDFNPRFYNQMAFDIARGLPLPLFAYYDAVGNERAIAEASSAAQHVNGDVRVFANRRTLNLLLTAQRISGVLTEEEARTWVEWYAENQAHCIDPVVDEDDSWPGRLDLAQMVRHSLRHPRTFLRTVVLNRS